jgi:hypothetical protein
VIAERTDHKKKARKDGHGDTYLISTLGRLRQKELKFKTKVQPVLYSETCQKKRKEGRKEGRKEERKGIFC